MTLKLLALNALSTIYLVLGSLHEETRLIAADGPAYKGCQESGTPFFLPGKRSSAPASRP